MRRIFILIIFFFLIDVELTSAQTLPIYRNYYFSPSVLNPAFNGLSGFTNLNIAYRQQWYGVEDSPEVGQVNFQLPTSKRMFFAADIYSEKSVLLRTSSFVLTAGYKLPISLNHSIRFALSGGGGFNKLDLTPDELNTTDPVILSAVDNNFFIDGRFGMLYNYKNFQLAMSLPQLFDRRSFNDKKTNDLKFSKLKNYVIYLSYKYYLNPKISIRSVALFQQARADNIMGGAVGMHYNDTFWIGVNYERSVGGFAGFGIGKFNIQYNYESSSVPGSTLSNESHGIQMSFRFGQKKNRNDLIIVDHSISTNEKDSIHVPQKITTDKKERNDELSDKTLIDNNNTTSKDMKIIEKDLSKKNKIKQEVDSVRTVESDHFQNNRNGFESNSQVRNDSIVIDKKLNKYSSPKENHDKLERVDQSNGDIVDITSSSFDNGINRRSNSLGMSKGFYVVAGVFAELENSIRFNRKVKNLGFQSDTALNLENDLFYVFVFYDLLDRKKARKVRDLFRKKRGFKKVWIKEVY